MAIERARQAGRTFVRKLQKNWRWSKTHRWAHLIEEHDLNPLVYGPRMLRKARWRWTNRDRETPATPVFLVGVQRSGTNMLAHGLDEAPELQVYNEGNAKAFHDFRLRPLQMVESLVERSRAQFVLFKPLCDSHRVVELLDRFHPRARVIWAYRDVDDRARSALAKFGDGNFRALRAFAAGQGQDAWQVQGVSPENADFIRSVDFDRLSAESGAALFWYIRNSLYFEMSLDRRQDAMLVSYDQFLAEPERVARAMCDFLGLDFRPRIISHIRPHRSARRELLPIDSRIRERCRELQSRLDAVALAPASKLIAERPIPRAGMRIAHG